MTPKLARNEGFTLVEIIAVMVILAVLSALIVPRYISLDASARLRGFEYGITELNGRETLAWANVKLTASGWIDDNQVWQVMDTTLGDDYTWAGAPTATGGRLEFKNTALDLVRNLSTASNPANWNK